MILIAIDIRNNSKNNEIWNNRSKHKKEWKMLLDDPNNQYDPISFYKEKRHNVKGYDISFIGQPYTIEEMLIKRFYECESYEKLNNEGYFDRIDVDIYDLFDYADDMANFINSLYQLI